MRYTKIKKTVLLLGFFLQATWCGAISTGATDGLSHIQINEAQVQGHPKGSSIEATIDGHYLSVVFLENLGQVAIEITSDIFGEVATESTPTPNGVNYFISLTGSYTITFTLPNGDVYYGEFEVTD